MVINSSHNVNILSESEFENKILDIENYLSKYVHKGYFKSFDNAKMYYEYFLTNENRASVVIVHGYTEFLKKYYELAWYLLQTGYNVFIYDLRGHGFSHRDIENPEITHVNDFNDYAKDLDCFINNIVIPASDAPIYIFSHSMGGAISAIYLSNFKSKVTKAVLSSPMIYPVCPPLPRMILRKLMASEAKKSGWMSKFKFSSDFNPDVTLNKSMDLSRSRFQHNLNMRISEPLYQNSSSTNRWNFEALGVIKKVLNRRTLKNICADVLVMTAGKDTVVKLKPQKKLVKYLGCKYKYFPDAKHSMYTMPKDKLEEYISEILNFYA